MLSYLRKQASKYRVKLLNPLYRSIYRDANQDISKSIMVAGAARSGTTRLAEMMASLLQARIVFEPFNRGLVKGYQHTHIFPYISKDATDIALNDFCEKIFRGRFRDPWTDQYVMGTRFGYRVIKAVRANLLLQWIKEAFPQVKLILIMRHPYSVIASRMRVGWSPEQDFHDLLSQESFIEQEMNDYVSYLRKLRSEEEKNAAVWAVSHLIPFKHLCKEDFHLVYFEELVKSPDGEMSNMMNHLGISWDPQDLNPKKASKKALGKSATIKGHEVLNSWKKVLNESQTSQIQEVLSTFGVKDLYPEETYRL